MLRRTPRWFSPAFVSAVAAALAAVALIGPPAAIRSDARGASSAPPSQTTGATIVVRAASVAALPGIEQHAASLGYASRRGDPALPALAVTTPNGIDAAAAIGAMIAYPGVLYAEPAYSMASTDTPADALFPKQTYLDKIQAPEAWDTETGDASVIVAVLDTGADIDHPDLAGRIWTNGGDIPANGVDDDDNGCIDDRHGCAFVELFDPGCSRARDGDIEDDGGHGTFVAGIIAANANSRGIVGVARGVTIMPVKVLDCGGGGTSTDVAIGMIYAARNGARVINVSLGSTSESTFLREAVRVAHDEYNALIVAASGNSGGEGVVYPARYDIGLAVGAAATNGTSRAPFSTAGPEVDVVAIGQGIIGTVPLDSCDRFLPCIGESPYAQANGTSFSAPQVSGLAALIISRRPGMTADGVAAAIKATADPIAQSGPNWAGAGRINMAKALKPAFRLGAPGTARD